MAKTTFEKVDETMAKPTVMARAAFFGSCFLHFVGGAFLAWLLTRFFCAL